MASKPKLNSRIISSLPGRGLTLILTAALSVILISIVIVHQFTPSNTLTMTTGFQGGAYAIIGDRYRQILAREKVQLKLLPSSGSIENLMRLRDKSSRIDAGFVQDGTSRLSDAENLVSLGAIGYAPLWVFYRSEELIDYLSELKGKRVAIGPKGSGVNKFALDLLRVNNIATPPTRLLEIDSASANKALLAGTLDAVMIFGTEDNALVKELLYAPEVKLLNFRQAEAYTRLIPALSHVVLPQGILNLSRRMPPQDVHLLAATTSLIVRKDLHPALVYLLLDAAVEIHNNAGWVNRKGEFPSPKELSFPSSNYAERYYKSGRPFLLDYLPFGIAAFVDRTMLIMVPVAIILIPLSRGIPWLYSWRHRRKLYQWYREVKDLELEVMASTEPEDLFRYHERIDRIEASISKIPVPLAFFDEVYKLQEHVNLVRGKLMRSSNQQEKILR